MKSSSRVSAHWMSSRTSSTGWSGGEHLDEPPQCPEVLLDRAGDAGRQSVEVAQQPVPLGNACGNVGFEVARAQHLDERRQRDRSFEVAPGLDDAGVGLRSGELRGQPALADTGVADDGHHSGRSRGDRVVEDGLQPAHLVGAADERSGVGGFGVPAEPLVHRHGRGPALDLDLAERFVAVSAACRRARSPRRRRRGRAGTRPPVGRRRSAHRRPGRRRRPRPRPHRCSPRRAERVRRRGCRRRWAARSTNAPAVRPRRRRRGRRRRARSPEHPRRP